MDYSLLHALGLLGGVAGFYWLIDHFVGRNGDEEEEPEEVAETVDDAAKEASSKDRREEECPHTRQLAVETLRQMGCVPEETEEERIRFDYQGVTFLMEAVDDCLFVNLIWPWCYSFSKFDIDEFARMRQVVNEINMKGSVSVFYSIADTDEVAVHMKKNFLFVSQVPQLKDYLKLMFDSFFRTARTLDVEIEKMRLKESTR
jgi:hypothetical protein